MACKGAEILSLTEFQRKAWKQQGSAFPGTSPCDLASWEFAQLDLSVSPMPHDALT